MSSGISCSLRENELISPCNCNSVAMFYPGNNNFKAIQCYNALVDDNRLAIIMDNLNQSSWARKHFKRLELLNTGIHELKENTLKGITFDEILIENNENLTTIHENAFIRTENVTKFIRISNNPELIYEDSSIFNCLSKFINVKKMTIANNAKITEIL